jgi:ABC-type uncharacterized transport system permease subunit
MLVTQNAILGATAVLLYAAAALLLMLRLTQSRRGDAWPKSLPLAIALGAAVPHALLLYHQLAVPGGLNLGFFNALSLVGWLAAMVVIVASAAGPVENLGIVVLPLSACAVALGMALQVEHLIIEAQPGLQTHIILSMLAYALLAMASVQALLLSAQDRALHRGRPRGLVRGLPPLVTMESLLFQMIAGGFVFLSLALLTGFLFLQDIFAQHLVHKTVLSIAAWFVFGVLLWGRWRHGWRGRKALHWTLSGIVALGLAYFGSKMVLELILQR